ncbi:MAG: dihydropteroate synthase [Candidatus Omnitrophota bacterium]
MIWKIRKNTVSFGRTLLMGILNITPDSFSDGGRYLDPEAAFAQAMRLVGEGADLLDLGAESTRPGASPVTGREELERLLPVLKRVRSEVPVPISIDTVNPEVAKKCLEAGADIINDVSGLRRSGPEMKKIVRKFGAGLVLMHSRGTPETMPTLAHYRNIVTDVMTELRESIRIATDAGIDREQIVVDPGLGFAKTTEQNLEIMKDLGVFHGLELPVMIGPSRKSFIGQVTGQETAEREFGTAACVASAVMNGIQIVRVHDVKAMRDVVRVTESIKRLSKSSA